MLKSYKAIFFDAGGTLLHPYPSVGEIYREVATRYGSFVDARHLEDLFKRAWLTRDGLSTLQSHSSEKIEREWWRSLVKEVFDQVGGIDNFDKFFDELYDLFARPQVWRVYPGTIEVLETLKKQNKKLGIISNWDSRLFKIAESLELSKYFDFILASAVFGASKPSAKIFEEALRQSGVEPHEAVHIGDSVEDDIHGAQRAGLAAIFINRHPSRPIKDLAFPVIHDLQELMPFGRLSGKENKQN